jgi:hypothetical protein
MGNNQTAGMKEAILKFEELYKVPTPAEAERGLNNMIDSGKLTDQILAGLPLESTVCKSDENTVISMHFVTIVGYFYLLDYY